MQRLKFLPCGRLGATQNLLLVRIISGSLIDTPKTITMKRGASEMMSSPAESSKKARMSPTEKQPGSTSDSPPNVDGGEWTKVEKKKKKKKGSKVEAKFDVCILPFVTPV